MQSKIKASIIDGKFSYEECFKEFLVNTNQKADTASVVEIFTDLLQRNSEFFCQENHLTLRILDVQMVLHASNILPK